MKKYLIWLGRVGAIVTEHRVAVGGLIVTGLGTVFAVIFGLPTFLEYIKTYREQRTSCEIQLRGAREDCDHDNYTKCIEKLEKAKGLCKDEDVNQQLQEAKLFDTLIQFNQMRMVRDRSKLDSISDEVSDLKRKLGDTARLRALQGILEEHYDRPEEAVKKYKAATDKDPNFAMADNLSGIAFYQWEMPDGFNRAIEALELASSKDEKYPWPYINVAGMWLHRASEDFTVEMLKQGQSRDFSKSRDSLERAKKQLEIADPLLPDNARRHILWAHYFVLQGQMSSELGLSDSNENFSKARNLLIDARNAGSKLVAIPLLLGIVYESQDDEDKALAEYKDAVTSDDKNVDARIAYVSFLQKRGEWVEGQSEVGRGMGIVKDLRAQFSERLRGTKDKTAEAWLKRAIQKCDRDKAILEAIAARLKSHNWQEPVEKMLNL